MRILFVSKGLLRPTGGAETAAIQILKGIMQQNKMKQITILTNKPEFLLKKQLDDLNQLKISKILKIYCTKLIKPRIPIFTDFLDAIRFKRAISKIVKQEKIDLIHIHTYSAFYITPNTLWNLPIVYTFNDFPIRWPRDPYNCFPINYIEKFWTIAAQFYWKSILSERNRARSSLYFHCNGSDSKDYLLSKRINEQNILLLANGYDKSKDVKSYNETIQGRLKRILDPQSQKLKILVVGQFNNIKNQYTLIKGFMDFSDIRKNSILLIVGLPTPIIGPFYMRKIWKDLKIPSRSNIIWFGFVSNVLLTELYRFTDLVVLMSHSEASPLVLGECKEMKKILISTRVGSLTELLSKDLTMLNPNSSKSLSSELEKIYYNRNILQRYRELIKNSEIPSWNDIGEEMCRFYISIGTQT